MLRRSRGKLGHGGAVVCESGGCLVLVLVVVVVSLKAHFLYFSAIFNIFGFIFCDRSVTKNQFIKLKKCLKTSTLDYIESSKFIPNCTIIQTK